ncbi:hypothetical protein PIROE2DRAFT_2404 [Piromyces sp. E2]|nr:hypothetical protein PIROE2DRAFT_2404 [Piromyces sp. E2]|eukprot:OUM69544.1 hypothetical protein PIROE2DRAFT_2404 [Piromyces sp. E2]
MFKKLFNHKKSSRCEICKKKIKNVDKNAIDKQCKECKENNSIQFISPVLIPLNDNTGKEIKRKTEKEIFCHGCNWPIISEKTIFKDLNNNVTWHNSCFEINKILGITIPIEPYDRIEKNDPKELRKKWTKCTIKLSKILIAYLCDCDYYAFEIVSCIKSKDFNSSTLKELIINIAYLLNFLIFESNKFNENLENNNVDLKQNELIELFINIIIFSESIKKNIIYTLNVKKLVRYLSQIHEIIKKELSNNLISLTKTCLYSEFKNTFEYISEFESFGYKIINSITPIYKVNGVDGNLNINWLKENDNKSNNNIIINSNDTLINSYINEKIYDEMEYLKENKIDDENNNSITEVNNESKNNSEDSISVSFKTLCENVNESVKDKGKENITNIETKNKNHNGKETIIDACITDNKIESSINDVKLDKKYDKKYDLIKSSVDNILLKNKHSFTNNENDNSHIINKININVNKYDNNDDNIKKTEKNDENINTNSPIKCKSINNSKNNKLLHSNGSQKKKQEFIVTIDKNGLNVDSKNNKDNNNNSLSQYNIHNIEDEKYNLKTEKSSSLYHNKENDNDNSEYARSFYSLNNFKNYYMRPSSSCSTANNSEFFDRASSPTYSMGKLEYTNKNTKSTDLSLDYSAYPLAPSMSSYSPKIGGINSTNQLNNYNESSDINNFNGNLSSLSVTSNSSVDVIKALSSSLKKGYFSSEAYLKYCKNNQSQNKNKVKDQKFNNSNYIKSNKKNKSYSNNSGINSEWSYEDENFENITTPIKLLNLQFQHEMKKAEDIVDESFERGSVYSQSVQSVDGNIENIKSSLLKIRSIFNNNNVSSSTLSTNSNVNLNDINSSNIISKDINNKNMNKLNNLKNQNLLNVGNKNSKAINLSQDLIYINKKLNEYNNQKKKHFSDKASISSEPNYTHHNINSRTILSSNSLNYSDNNNQIFDKNDNNINNNLLLTKLNSKSNNISVEKLVSKKNINDKSINNYINKTVTLDKKIINGGKTQNLSTDNNTVNRLNNNKISANKNLINSSSISAVSKFNNSIKVNNIDKNSNNSNSNIILTPNVKTDSNEINKTKTNVINNSLNNDITKSKINKNSSTISTNSKITQSNNGIVLNENKNTIDAINQQDTINHLNNNNNKSNNNDNINNINNKIKSVELNNTNKNQVFIDNKNQNNNNPLINDTKINNTKKLDLQKNNTSTSIPKEVTPKGILSSMPTKNNKKSSLILPSKEELKIQNKENEYKPFIRNHSLLKNQSKSPVQQYMDFIKLSKNKSLHSSDRSSSYKKKQKEVKKYRDGQRIDSLIYDSVIKYGRDEKVANQWISQLNRQEIFTVGDLRSLYENDWYHLGLSVLAIRAIKDTLYYTN